jgi:L-threonylcarbamoyladenylate synthase
VTDRVKSQVLSEGVKALEGGGVLVVPTDTSYGLVVDATNVNAVLKVFKIKKRPFSSPIHIIVNSVRMGMNYADFTPGALKLCEVFLPGPLTIVLNSRRNLPELLTAGKSTIGIRIPKKNIVLEMVEIFKKPITATSANIHGEPDVYSIEDLPWEIGKNVDMVLDVGQIPEVKPSTLVDLTSLPPKILRIGPISSHEIFEVLGLKEE